MTWNASSLGSASDVVRRLTVALRSDSCSVSLGFAKLPCQQDGSFTPSQLSEQLRSLWSFWEFTPLLKSTPLTVSDWMSKVEKYGAYMCQKFHPDNSYCIPLICFSIPALRELCFSFKCSLKKTKTKYDHGALHFLVISISTCLFPSLGQRASYGGVYMKCV